MSLRSNKIKVPEEISVRKFFDYFKDAIDLQLICGEDGFDRMILEPTINRPALAITGYYKNFASSRIQLFGAGEMAYMRDLPDQRQFEVMEEMIAHEIDCAIFRLKEDNFFFFFQRHIGFAFMIHQVRRI